jgi:hypothetical protein
MLDVPFHVARAMFLLLSESVSLCVRRLSIALHHTPLLVRQLPAAPLLVGFMLMLAAMPARLLPISPLVTAPRRPSCALCLDMSLAVHVV